MRQENLQTTVISIPEVETIILCTNYSLSILRKEVTIRSTLFTTTNSKVSIWYVIIKAKHINISKNGNKKNVKTRKSYKVIYIRDNVLL